MDKLYNISKTAEILDVTPKTLRIWDKENKLKAVLTSGGHRRYKESDINKIIGENSLAERKYNVTQKHIYCDYRCTGYEGITILNCLKCKKYSEELEETSVMTLTELFQKINSGNCYITKVEEIKI